jgi:hypothetical protein
MPTRVVPEPEPEATRNRSGSGSWFWGDSSGNKKALGLGHAANSVGLRTPFLPCWKGLAGRYSGLGTASKGEDRAGRGHRLAEARSRPMTRAGEEEVGSFVSVLIVPLP